MTLSPTERRLLNAYQRDFPLESRPFARIGAALGLDERRIIDLLRGLAARGVLSRVGAVVRPNTVGASTLAAMSVPRGRLDEVAAIVSARPEVNHNYEREHALNLWFVVTAEDREAVAAILAELEAESGLAVLDLPLVTAYHIDLGFDLSGTPFSPARHPADAPRPGDTDHVDRRLLAVIENGLPLVERPFAGAAAAAGLSEVEATARLRRLVACGVIARFGFVVRHHEIGYRANAMAVWSVPDHSVDSLGQRLAAYDYVTLCYRRRRSLPSWPYNLFCMIHGRDQEIVRRQVARLVTEVGLSDVPHAVLFSRRCFKQHGARYGVARTDGRRGAA